MKPRDNPASENHRIDRTMPSKPLPWPGEFAAQLREQPPPPALREAIAARLSARALASAQAHKAFKVTRREEGCWQARGPGAKARTLYESTQFCVEFVQLASGAEMPWNDHDHGQEILLLQGELLWQGSPMAPMAYGVRGLSVTPVVAGPDGAHAYVRRLRVDPTALAHAESRWWQQAMGQRVNDALAGAWTGHAQGMQVRPLAQSGDVASMLIRLAPGGVAPDHDHPIPEDCMMIEGELFLGDILLRALDYQLAPTEAPHCSISSDTGALFFVHGTLSA